MEARGRPLGPARGEVAQGWAQGRDLHAKAGTRGSAGMEGVQGSKAGKEDRSPDRAFWPGLSPPISGATPRVLGTAP